MATSVCILSLALLLCSPTLAFLVPSSSPHLSYHHGPLLAGPQPINLYLTYYGKFRPSDQATLRAFLSSLSGIKEDQHPQRRSMRTTPYNNIIETPTPTVANWWAVTRHYADVKGRSVSQKLEVCGETKDDTYSLGRHLKAEDIALLAKTTAEAFSVAVGGAYSGNSVILIFTAQDVYIEGFCMHSCGGHSEMHMESPNNGGGSKVPYAWVGNSGEQCPGLCAWPFARPQYGPPMDPLKAPNGRDVDGMVITLANLLVSIATNPLGNAYYQGGDGGDNVSNNFGLEVGGACFGQFGTGSYPGYPGLLVSNPTTGASYNVEGIGGTQFLVPWIWNPSTLSCVGQA